MILRQPVSERAYQIGGVFRAGPCASLAGPADRDRRDSSSDVMDAERKAQADAAPAMLRLLAPGGHRIVCTISGCLVHAGTDGAVELSLGGAAPLERIGWRHRGKGKFGPCAYRGARRATTLCTGRLWYGRAAAT